MTITSNILAILNALKDEQRLEAVVYNRPTKVNVDLDTTAHPVAVLFLLRDGTIELSNGLYRESAQVNVSFLTHQRELNFDGLSNDSLIDDMSSVATEFVCRIIATSALELVGDTITMRGVYDYDDKNTTGVNLQFTIRETQGHCLLPTEPPTPPEPEPTPEPDNDDTDEANQDEGDNATDE